MEGRDREGGIIATPHDGTRRETPRERWRSSVVVSGIDARGFRAERTCQRVRAVWLDIPFVDVFLRLSTDSDLPRKRSTDHPLGFLFPPGRGA